MTSNHSTSSSGTGSSSRRALSMTTWDSVKDAFSMHVNFSCDTVDAAIGRLSGMLPTEDESKLEGDKLRDARDKRCEANLLLAASVSTRGGQQAALVTDINLRYVREYLQDAKGIIETNIWGRRC